MHFIALSPYYCTVHLLLSLIINEKQQTLHKIIKIIYPLYIPLIICKNVQDRAIFAVSICYI